MATISAGDSVMVLLDPDVFKIAQLDHGGWIQNMAEVSVRGKHIYRTGTVCIN